MFSKKSSSPILFGSCVSLLHPDVRTKRLEEPQIFGAPATCHLPTCNVEKNFDWIRDPQMFFKSGDCFSDTPPSSKDEEEFNIITRLIIVLAILIIIISVGRWWILLALTGILLLILWLTVIPSMAGAQNGIVVLSSRNWSPLGSIPGDSESEVV